MVREGGSPYIGSDMGRARSSGGLGALRALLLYEYISSCDDVGGEADRTMGFVGAARRVAGLAYCADFNAVLLYEYKSSGW